MRDLVGLGGVSRAEGAVAVEGYSASVLVRDTRENLLTLPVIAVCEFRQESMACQRGLERRTARLLAGFGIREGVLEGRAGGVTKVKLSGNESA